LVLGWRRTDRLAVLAPLLLGLLWYFAFPAQRGLPSFLLRRLLRLQPPYAAACVLALGLKWHSTLAPGYQRRFSVTLSQALTALLSDNLYLTGVLGVCCE